MHHPRVLGWACRHPALLLLARGPLLLAWPLAPEDLDVILDAQQAGVLLGMCRVKGKESRVASCRHPQLVLQAPSPSVWA